MANQFLSSNPPYSCPIHLPWPTLEVDKLPNDLDKLPNLKNRGPLLRQNGGLTVSPPAPPSEHANWRLKPLSPSPTHPQSPTRAPTTRRPPSPPLLPPHKHSTLPQRTSRAYCQHHPHCHLLLLCHHTGFLTNSQTKTIANGVFFEIVVKSVKITLSHPVLESIFGLKFVDTAPPNLSRKASSLKIKLPDTTSAPVIANTLTKLKDNHADIRTHLEHIQAKMGLMNRKIDELIRLTSLIHHGTKLAIPVQSTDIEKAT
ncbi:hypothetical protein Cgig2_007162 [Carnegiea gigantea]|uniref:Uncharacterized protein n=1 Tax=Carnegiea gigantea TaxID=171969 RepID=A0A9Q1GTV2_9CARY|nr:hypothetical protein Cgig2_007162 [Carnegiea gigantea]